MNGLQHPSNFTSNERKAYSQALLRTLACANVKFVRYMAVDLFNTPRCKALPVSQLQKSSSVDKHVAINKVCFGGVPAFADVMVEGTGLDAEGTVVYQPDLSTLRILPYNPKSAIVLGTLHDQTTGLLSQLCTRGLLQQVVAKAAEERGIGFNVGVELEFMLLEAKTNQPVDQTNYAHSFTLVRQEDFIDTVTDQLSAQGVEIEMVHAECAPGQLEFVLCYQEDPVQLADNVVLARETISAVAHQQGLKALFLPKVDAEQAGNGCHIHMSFRDLKTGCNLFCCEKALSRRRQSFLLGASTDISAQGQSFMEGILQHLPGLLALTLPSVNSFRRVGKGCWTGHAVDWAFEDKESPLRVVANLHAQAWEHVELKLCDSTANIYVALAAVLSAGISGLEKDLDLRASRHDADKGPSQPLPTSFQESLDCLEKDELLMSVLPSPMSRAYLACRRAEAERSNKMSLEDEVAYELGRA